MPPSLDRSVQHDVAVCTCARSNARQPAL